MTGDTGPRADDDRRGCVILGNWVLVGLGVACVAFHVGAVASVADPLVVAEGWIRFGVLLLAVPSLLIGATLAVAAGSRRVVPRPIRRVELGLVLLIAAGMAIELLTVL
jgi:hypothetical protein